jgi:ribosome-binding factor A
MSKERLPRINELIKEEISKILLREVEFLPEVLVTVTRVETTIDLLDTNVFISVFPESYYSKTMEFLTRKTGFLQKEIKQILRMRPLPRLHFLAEKETRKAARIEEILEELKNKEK